MEAGFAAGWKEFYLGTAGAAAALAGLLFVALSINLTRILQLSSVPSRAAETVLLLATALMTTLVALIPHETPSQLGVLLTGIGILVWGLPTGVQLRELRRRQYYQLRHAVTRLVLHQAATLPLLVGGVLLCLADIAGLYWFAAAVMVSMAVSLMNAWILLVEIMR